MLGGLGRPGTRGLTQLGSVCSYTEYVCICVGISSLSPGLSPGLVLLLGGGSSYSLLCPSADLSRGQYQPSHSRRLRS